MSTFEPVPPVPEKSALPTRKWFAQQIVAAGTFLVALIQNGWELSSELQVVLVGLVVAAATTYIVPNENTPGGVPLKGATKNNEKGQTEPLHLLVWLIVLIVVIILLFALLDRV